jgi:hypothetical protein
MTGERHRFRGAVADDNPVAATVSENAPVTVAPEAAGPGNIHHQDNLLAVDGRPHCPQAASRVMSAAAIPEKAGGS